MKNVKDLKTYKNFGEALLEFRSIWYWLPHHDGSITFRLRHHLFHLDPFDFVHHVKHVFSPTHSCSCSHTVSCTCLHREINLTETVISIIQTDYTVLYYYCDYHTTNVKI